MATAEYLSLARPLSYKSNNDGSQYLGSVRFPQKESTARGSNYDIFMTIVIMTKSNYKMSPWEDFIGVKIRPDMLKASQSHYMSNGTFTRTRQKQQCATLV